MIAAIPASATPLAQASDGCTPEQAWVFAWECDVLAGFLGEQMGTPIGCPELGASDNLPPRHSP